MFWLAEDEEVLQTTDELFHRYGYLNVTCQLELLLNADDYDSLVPLLNQNHETTKYGAEFQMKF